MKMLEDRRVVILDTIEEWDNLTVDLDKAYGDLKTIELIGYPGGSKVMMKQDSKILSIYLDIDSKGYFSFSLFGIYKVTLQNNTKEQQELYRLIRLGLM